MKIRIKKENILIISAFQDAIGFCFLGFMFYDFPEYRIAAAVTYLVASATTYDGWLARRYGWVSRTGKILDPLADKLFHMTVLVSFGQRAPAVAGVSFCAERACPLTLGYLMIKKRCSGPEQLVRRQCRTMSCRIVCAHGSRKY